MKLREVVVYIFLILIGVGTSASSCEDPEEEMDFPPIDRGDVVANRILFSFWESGNPNGAVTYEYYAPNGILAKVDTIKLERPIASSFKSYRSAINFLNNNDTMLSRINARQDRYTICYRNMNDDNLRLTGRNEDQNNFPLGTECTWTTVDFNRTAGDGFIRVTLNYQPSGKTGSCDVDTRIIEAIYPYIRTN